MAAKHAVTEGKYDEAKRDLKSALAATQNPPVDDTRNTLWAKPMRAAGGQHDGFPEADSPLTGSSSAASAGCLPATNSAKPDVFHASLVNASYVVDADPGGQSQSNTASASSAVFATR